MPPVAPLGREAAIQKVVDGELPFRFGSKPPIMMALQQDGVFRIRELLVDRADAMSASQRKRSPSWMPEHYYALGQPIGKIYAEGETIGELVEVMKTMDWPEHW